MDDEKKWRSAYDFLTMEGEFPEEYVDLVDAALLVDFLSYLADEGLLRPEKEGLQGSDCSGSEAGA